MKITSSTARPIVLVEDLDSDYETLARGFQRIGVTSPLKRFTRVEDASSYLQDEADFDEKEEIPGLIILDLKLEDGDARELLMKIKGNHHLKAVPIAVWSALEDPQIKADCYKRGVTNYIRKLGDRASIEETLQLFKKLLDTPHYPPL